MQKWAMSLSHEIFVQLLSKVSDYNAKATKTQDAFDVKLYFQMTDDEKFLIHPEHDIWCDLPNRLPVQHEPYRHRCYHHSDLWSAGLYFVGQGC
jgi:hypothetical protein